MIEDPLGGPQFEGHRATDVWCIIAINENGDEGLASVGGIDDSIYPPQLGLPEGSVVMTRMPLIATAPQMRDLIVEAARTMKATPTGAGQTFVLRHYTLSDTDEVI